MARHIYLGIIAVLVFMSQGSRGRKDGDELRSTGDRITRSKSYRDIVAEKIYNDIKDDMNKGEIKESLGKRASSLLNEIDEYHLGGFPYVPTRPRPAGLWGKRNVHRGPPGLWGRDAKNSLKRDLLKEESGRHKDVVKGPPGLWGRDEETRDITNKPAEHWRREITDNLLGKASVESKFDSNGPPGLWGRELREKLDGRIFNVGPPGLWGREMDLNEKDIKRAAERLSANAEAVRGPPGLWGRSSEDTSHSSNRLKREGPPGLWGRDVAVGPPGLWGKRVVKRLLSELIEKDLERLDEKSHSKP